MDPEVRVPADHVPADDRLIRAFDIHPVVVTGRRKPSAVMDPVADQTSPACDALTLEGTPQDEAARAVAIRHVVADECDTIAVHLRAGQVPAVAPVQPEVADHDVLRRV